jgi:hypothetical protein
VWWAWLLVGILAVSAYVTCMSLLFRTARRRADEIERGLLRQRVERYTRKANFFGRDSSGMKQLRGNGILALTREELQYHMFLPKKAWRIPLGRIQEIEHPRSFKGRSVFRELLVVSYRDENGFPERIGILVEDPRQWAADIMKYKRWLESFGAIN